MTFILITCHSINQRQPKLDLTYCKQSTINPFVHWYIGMDCVMNEWLTKCPELALNALVLCCEEKKKKNSRYWKKRRSMTLMSQSMLLADYKRHLTKTLQSLLLFVRMPNSKGLQQWQTSLQIFISVGTSVVGHGKSMWSCFLES